MYYEVESFCEDDGKWRPFMKRSVPFGEPVQDDITHMTAEEATELMAYRIKRFGEREEKLMRLVRVEGERREVVDG